MAEKEEEEQNSKLLLKEKDQEIEFLKAQIEVLEEKVLYFYLGNSTDHVSEAKQSTCSCTCHASGKTHAETQTFESDFISTDSTGSALDWAVDKESNVTVSDILRQVVEKQVPGNDYIYDENYNMYYSPSTGYYYDTARNLLFDPYSQMYYSYNCEKNAYQIYCGVSTENDITKVTADGVNSPELQDFIKSLSVCQSTKKKKGNKCNKQKKAAANLTKSVSPCDTHISDHFVKESADNGNQSPFSIAPPSPEEGEILSDTSGSISSENVDNRFTFSSPVTSPLREDSSEEFPPCIRAIVKESNQEKIGNVILITCTGGQIGRDKKSPIFVTDTSLSRAHAKVTFNDESWEYSITDLGSQNGTFVNGIQLTLNSGINAESHILNHGDILRLGTCELLIHIHPGRGTCDECEPGQIQAEFAKKPDNNPVFLNKEERERERRRKLKQMKKKFGLQDMDFVNGSATFSKNSGYQDKAKARRKEKGSQNPHEKTETSSLETSLPSSNKGYEMLKKMGWTEGQALGAGEGGILEPIPINVRAFKAGLGSSDADPNSSFPEDRKTKIWKKAQERYYTTTDTETAAKDD